MATTLDTVSSLYKQILGRDAASSEAAYWVSRIDSAVESVAEVVWAFTASDEAASNVAPIVNLYFSAFGRVPDAAGLQYWLNAHHNGMSLGGIAQAFTQSAEFAQAASAQDESFLTSLYQNALGRTPDAAGLSYWIEQLANGLSRDQVLSAISASAQSQSATGVTTQIVLAYNGLLGRSPSQAEIHDIMQSQSGKSSAELIKDTANALLAGGGTAPTPPGIPTAPATPTETTFTPIKGSLAGSSDASGAVALDGKYMIVGDDEASVLRVYDRAGGDALVEWDYSDAIGSAGELDLEALTLVGDSLYVTGSHSNTKKGVDADSREIVFSVKVSGTGVSTQFAYQGKFTGFEAALVAWDESGSSGKPAGYFGFAASSDPGLAPENTNGFSIEGMTTSVDNSELWLGFRAPQTDTVTRDKALIVPVDNYLALLDHSATTPVFGEAIELNLGGRGIRSIDKAIDGSGYLIVAGPSGVASADVTHDFRLYTWDGKASSAPVELDNNLDALLKATGGSFESIVSPASIKPGTQVQLLQDNGDTIWPGQTSASKDLDPADQHFLGNLITLGSPVTDTTAPLLMKASPDDGGTGVAVSSSLSLIFDEGVALGVGTLQLQDANGNTVQTFKLGDTGVKIDYNKITLQPADKLTFSSNYKLVISADAVTDHSGNALAGKTISFTTGEVPHYEVLITEVNSNAVAGDFFEVYNYGSTPLDLSGWRMNDEAGTFSDATGLPANLTLAAGQSLLVASVKDADFAAFKTAWGLDDRANVISIDGPGLGKADAVVLFDANGNVATAFNYDAASVKASDGTVITQSLATNAFTNGAHAGAAYGSTATASAVWDGVSTANAHYIGAVAGQLGAYAQAGSSTSVGSPGVVEIVQTGATAPHLDRAVA
ncbi:MULTISPECIES: DUF3616 domain-containing protein [unclassified Pseudomonas]|uniref:DUF3616 domain-containing protein n=1 Tax=unclassified Pseudomonas TaxID=196821 RepID=UPI0025FCB08D|nr:MULTISPECIES: DUF3616 domain-containing protein [unclassified Pseudomonas]